MSSVVPIAKRLECFAAHDCAAVFLLLGDTNHPALPLDVFARTAFMLGMTLADEVVLHTTWHGSTEATMGPVIGPFTEAMFPKNWLLDRSIASSLRLDTLRVLSANRMSLAALSMMPQL